ncbi:7906_t:CDS:1, partial [Acaulospora colombiana]
NSDKAPSVICPVHAKRTLNEAFPRCGKKNKTSSYFSAQQHKHSPGKDTKSTSCPKWQAYRAVAGFGNLGDGSH